MRAKSCVVNKIQFEIRVRDVYWRQTGVSTHFLGNM